MTFPFRPASLGQDCPVDLRVRVLLWEGLLLGLDKVQSSKRQGTTKCAGLRMKSLRDGEKALQVPNPPAIKEAVP